MKSQLIHQDAQRTYALIFDKGDEFISEITRFAKEQKLDASHFTAIGAFRSAVLGFFDRDRKDYKRISVDTQVEVLSLVGDIAAKNGAPKTHAHVVLGKDDGAAIGGHILEAHVWPTLEVVLTESPSHLCRRTDEETGLALIDISKLGSR